MRAEDDPCVFCGGCIPADVKYIGCGCGCKGAYHEDCFQDHIARVREARADSLLGIDPDFTGDMTTEEYVKKHWNGEPPTTPDA